MKTLRVLTIGAGAIGTYIGGSLGFRGHQVVFVEHPQVVEQLRSRGLKIQQGLAGTANGDEPSSFHIQPDEFKIVTSIEEAFAQGNYDIIIYALKSYDTPIFIDSLQLSGTTLTKLPAFLCLSNGVDNEPALAEVIGADRVIAGTVTSAVGRKGAGDIILERLRGVGVASNHPISEHVTAAFNDAGMNARLYSQPADMKWSKLLTNLIANASSAILDMSPAEIFANPNLFQLEIKQLREALAVMRAQKIEVVDLPGTPVRLLAFAARYLPLVITRPFMAKAVGGGRGGKMPSFHIDLHSGRGKSEVDYLNGAVVRAGKEFGIPTPVNQVLTETLLKLTNKDLEITQFASQPEKLLRLL